MATVQQMKATVRPKGGKGAARAARYSGRVPGVIYGENQPPIMVLLEHDDVRDPELRQVVGRRAADSTGAYDDDLRRVG